MAIDKYRMEIDLEVYETHKFNPDRWAKKAKQREKLIKDQLKADQAAIKFLAENPNINIGCLVESLQQKLLSTIKCAELLGISPEAFRRLRKKYNIEPVYSISNRKRGLLPKVPSGGFPSKCPKLSVKNFFTQAQLDIIPEAELKLVQVRAARSLKFPNGLNNPFVWTRRGTHSNGKLRARIKALLNNGFRVDYNEVRNEYMVSKDNNTVYLTRAEVDKMNHKYNKLKVFT